MRRDPIVREVREARNAYAAQFEHNLDRIVEDLRRRQDAGEFQVVRRLPRLPRRIAKPHRRKERLA